MLIFAFKQIIKFTIARGVLRDTIIINIYIALFFETTLYAVCLPLNKSGNVEDLFDERNIRNKKNGIYKNTHRCFPLSTVVSA